MGNRKFNVYRDGFVYVSSSMCGTCIYRPDSVNFHSSIKEKAVKASTGVVCHSTLDKEQQAICKGFYDQDMTITLAMARAMGNVRFVKAEKL